MKNRYCAGRLAVFCIMLLLMSRSAFADDSFDTMQQNLASAFTRAFNDPAEFRAAGIFQLLGYSDDEITEIGRITPHPAAIKVVAEPDAGAGCFKNISVECSKVLYYNLTIDRVVFDFPDCRLCLDELAQGRLRFLGSEKINLITEVSTADIAKVFDLVARARSLTSLRIKLEENRARITGRVKRGLFVVDFNITGDTELVDPKTVVFRCDRMLLNRAVVPRNTVNALFREINPVFNARKTWLNLNIANIYIRQGFVHTIATIERRKS
ncbi:MAG: hypothetical protein CVV42_20600 [Candidatus Riflebacteria bacterium HGW-Riflebacteria-2]|jgi:hypothetical protein|nr:MAG: hypothetical protein CVV42_20600 [Candidatus Riflebacteria bacterium HGW-Riflebacteria-2]